MDFTERGTVLETRSEKGKAQSWTRLLRNFLSTCEFHRNSDTLGSFSNDDGSGNENIT